MLTWPSGLSRESFIVDSSASIQGHVRESVLENPIVTPDINLLTSYGIMFPPVGIVKAV